MGRLAKATAAGLAKTGRAAAAAKRRRRIADILQNLLLEGDEIVLWNS